MPKLTVPSNWGLCFAGNEEAFCCAIDVAIASTDRPFRYVEIGLGFGGGMHAVIQYLEQSGIEFSCDGVDLPEYPIQNCQPHDRLTLRLVGSTNHLISMRANNELANMVFIDGCHGRQCVTNDFLAAERIIKPGGVIAFHDTDPGCQGIHFQPHCGEGINARQAVEKLGLLTDSREGWRKLWETAGNKDKGGHGCLFVQKV